MDIIAGGIGGALGLLFVVWLLILLPASMARNRNRSAVGWVLVSCLFSPVVAVLLLALLGKAASGVQAAQ